MSKNLHSLLSTSWFIDENYSQSLIPALFSILSGSTQIVEGENPNTVMSIDMKGNATAVAPGASLRNEQQVIVVSQKSPIYKYDQKCGPTGTKTLMATLDLFKDNPNVAGVVLDADTGGGQVDGTGETFDYIMAYPKPFVTYTDGTLASAALYLAGGSKKIIANKRASAIGSLGTMFSRIDMTGAIEKAGGKVQTFYASKSIKKNDAIRQLAAGDEGKAVIAQMVDPLNEDFHADMKAARPNMAAEVYEGNHYNAQRALELGIIDQIGTLQDAVDAVIELSQVNNSNTNTTMKTTDRPILQEVLGLDGPLASLEDHSSLSNVALDAIESHLANVQTQVTDAQAAQETAEQALAAAQAADTTAVTALTALATANEIEVAADADTATVSAAVQAHIDDLGSRDAATHTVVKTDTKQEAQPTNVVGGVDITAYLNN